MMNRWEEVEKVVVIAEQMREIEGRVFAAGMPVAALMEKVAGLITRRVLGLYSEVKDGQDVRRKSILANRKLTNVGILVGPGHNGGDALVVARELYLKGCQVRVYCPFPKLKDLTSQHAEYAKSLGILFDDRIASLADCELIIDGLFGFGLERAIADPVFSAINQINQWAKPIVSIDLPSGLHTDTGEVLGTAIRATHTLCLGLWKLGLWQDSALEYVGKAELIDFDLPWADIAAVLGETPKVQRVTAASAIASLPLSRPPVTHKYKMGHLLLICGSRRYAGGAILTALGARASGVGMLSVAVPESLKPLLVAQLPEALIVGCPETVSGAIAHLPDGMDLASYNAIACGPGLTTDAAPVVKAVLEQETALVLDADGLNILAQMGTISTLANRRATTVLTPHAGEFKRLFPDIALSSIEGEGGKMNRINRVLQAAEQTGAVVLLKGARTAIASPSGYVWIIPESTPALARGGSGDVLTGLTGGLIAQAVSQNLPLESMVPAAAWWHAQGGILAAKERTELGVDAFTLTQYLMPALTGIKSNKILSL